MVPLGGAHFLALHRTATKNLRIGEGPGCSSFVDNIGHLAHLHARDTSLVLVSRAPLAKIEPYKKRMGWTVPWVSSNGSDFNRDFGVTTQDGETFGLSVFLREGETA